jgi:hypothetical protein
VSRNSENRRGEARKIAWPQEPFFVGEKVRISIILKTFLDVIMTKDQMNVP